jgi:hypothetical protein
MDIKDGILLLIPEISKKLVPVYSQADLTKDPSSTVYIFLNTNFINLHVELNQNISF